MQRISKVMTTILMVVGLIAALAGMARADSAPIAQVTASSLTAQLTGASASANDVATGKVTVLSDMKIKGVVVSGKNCFWTKPGQKWWNGGHGASGTEFQLEKTPAKLCHKGKMLVKVEGGSTGRRCFNEARLVKPEHVVKGRVIWVSMFANVKVNLSARVEVAVTAICGFAKASASSAISLSLKQYIKARGPATSRLFDKVAARASASASASLSCITTTVPVTVPVVTPPVITPPVVVVITPPVVIPPVVCVPPKENIGGICALPKNGTPGQGSTTPGQPGGTGSGGSPGPGAGPVCRDKVTGTDRPGPSGTDGWCTDQPGPIIAPPTTGGSTTPVPVPPADKCKDPFTNQDRNMASDETKDQFGYCVKK